jgi:hypothetical protein
MAFLTRSVTCIVVNKTSCALGLSSSEHLHGSADTPIPEVIPAGSSGKWTSSTAGVFTGTEGRVVFEVEEAEATFEVYWDNPFIGTNAFKQSFKLQPDVGESPAGKYVSSVPSGEDLEDADDVTVTYTLTIEPHPEVAPRAGAGGAVAVEPTPPPPDEDAPQVVEAQPGVENHASGIGVLTAPRLSVALNAVDPSDAGTDTSIDATLALIAKRLEGGLDVVWKKGAAMGLWDPTKWKESDPEEQWARAITELLLGQPYNGAAAPYGRFDQDTIFYKPFTDPSASPLVSLTAACQHNASFGVLSRGFALSDAGGTGFSCDEASSMAMFKTGGKWFRDEEKLDLSKAIDAGLAPGSIYVFKPPPLSAFEKKQNLQREGSHIAFVLRVDRDQKQAQFFDTGGLQHRERRGGPVPAIMMKFPSLGAYDDPLWDKVTTKHYIGMGIPRPPADLPAAVARIRRTRPIAFARLVLTTRGAKFSSPIDPKSPPPDLLFVSRLLRTWGDAEDQNFTIARCFWSLRNLPCTREVQALWFFYVPQDVYPDPKATAEQKMKARTASAVLAAPRTTKVDDFGVPLHRQCYLVIGSLADGQVIQIQRRATQTDGNEPGSTTKATSKEVVKPKDGVPGNLHKLLDRLPPSGMVVPSSPALPLLFKDYVDLTA